MYIFIGRILGGVVPKKSIDVLWVKKQISLTYVEFSGQYPFFEVAKRPKTEPVAT